MTAAGEHTIEINITPEFFLACETCEITPEQALQYFVDSLFTFAAVTAAVYNDEFPILEVIRNYTQYPSAAPHQDNMEPVNLKYFNKMRKLFVERMGKDNFLDLHRKLINQWYKELKPN